MNTIFNCVKEDLESRGMKFEFETGKLKLPFRNENYFIFYEDGKWESFDKAQNKVFPGTWECEKMHIIFSQNGKITHQKQMNGSNRMFVI